MSTTELQRGNHDDVMREPNSVVLIRVDARESAGIARPSDAAAP